VRWANLSCWRKIFSGFHVPKIMKKSVNFLPKITKKSVNFWQSYLNKLKGCPFLRHGVGDGRSCRVTASHLSKVANYNLPHLHLAPPLGAIPFAFCRDLRPQKTRVLVLWWGILCMIICLAISVEHRLMIDKQIGRHTTMACIYRASMALRGK